MGWGEVGVTESLSGIALHFTSNGLLRYGALLSVHHGKEHLFSVHRELLFT
jgi:hypothetical protein